LTNFGLYGMVNDLLDFGKLFFVQLEVYASAHADQFSTYP